MRRNLCAILLLHTLVFGTALCAADEGMWLFNDPPTQALRDSFGFEPDRQWLDHLQRSCVRFGASGSASIVSPHGLLMTNHHVGFQQIKRLSNESEDLMATGFVAREQSEERKCPDLSVYVLQSVEDVTKRVVETAPNAATTLTANTLQNEEIARIEAECHEATGHDCGVVILFHGAAFHLYRYKVYDDVRLVMAPEQMVAYYGGDADNFDYPRYSLDACFFRIYENDRPIESKHYLRWSQAGASEGDLAFVAGHPYRTRRQYTMSHLEFLRDVSYPTILRRLWRREVKLSVFAAEDLDQARLADADLKGCQNSRKAFTGALAGLHDPNLLTMKSEAEKKLMSAIVANHPDQHDWMQAWNRLDRALESETKQFERFSAMEGRRRVFRSQLLKLARLLVRHAVEGTKPDAQRESLFRQANADQFNSQLFSEAPIEPALEIHVMESALSYFLETYGGRDRMTRVLLGGESPASRARSLVEQTKVGDPEMRRQLARSGITAVEASADPMIRLAVNIETEVEALRRIHRTEVESIKRDAYAHIAAARNTVESGSTYPDATGSLRLAFGTIRGYDEYGTAVPWHTTLRDAFTINERYGNKPPYQMPAPWVAAKSRMNLDTPFNFVCDVDVIGGNSGSPVVNRQGEVIGLVFDINSHALVWDFHYTSNRARTVAVDARAIMELLRQVYDARSLVAEILGNAR